MIILVFIQFLNMGASNVNVKFRSDFDQKKISNNTLLALQEDFYGNTKLQHGKWNQLQIPKYTKYIQQWTIHNLSLHTNNTPTIIKDIVNINFTNLLQLDLERNNLESIQKLCWIRMPNLGVLSIGSNSITNIAELRKMPYLTQLHTLSIRKNKIIEGDKLTQMLLPKLQNLIIEYWYEDPHQITNIKFCSKLKSQLQNLMITSPLRLNDKKLIKRLTYKNMNKQVVKFYLPG